VTSEQSRAGRAPAPPRAGRQFFVVLAIFATAVSIQVSIGLVVWSEANATEYPACGGDNGCPIASALNLSANRDSSGMNSHTTACATDPCNFYNFEASHTAYGVTLGNLIFLLKNPGGSVYVSQVGLTVIGSSGIALGTWSFGGGWTPSLSNNLSFEKGDTLVVYATSPSPAELTGFTLSGLGQGGFSGSVPFPIV
jgi:hypothetical protein